MITDEQDILETTDQVVFMIPISCYPDIWKGVLKGVVRALALQNASLFIHLVSNWLINLSLIYQFVWVDDEGLVGIWKSKAIMDSFTVLSHFVLIHLVNWHRISQQSIEI